MHIIKDAEAETLCNATRMYLAIFFKNISNSSKEIPTFCEIHFLEMGFILLRIRTYKIRNRLNFIAMNLVFTDKICIDCS